jgi:peptide/nickel transport system substrate-binding protein
VRFTWDEPNPQFLPALAGPSPLFIYRPAHYLRQYHARYVGLDAANAKAKAAGSRNWVGLHQKKDEQFRFDNPDLPTLEPWINTTPVPSTRFVLVRNPYFHRVDRAARQLPYIDRVIVSIADDKLIPAKAGAGDVDLQARYLRFDNYTFLKQSSRRNQYRVLLWEKGIGSQMALYPNLNVEDPAWRALMRDVRFRRALSMGIDRHEINEVVYFGLQNRQHGAAAQPPHRLSSHRMASSMSSGQRAARRLGHQARRGGIRLLPDGRPMEVIVDTPARAPGGTSWSSSATAGEGRRMFAPSQREIFRKRVSGSR